MESVVCELARFIVVFHGFDDVLGAVDCGAGLAGGIEAARTRMHADIEDLSRAGGQTGRRSVIAAKGLARVEDDPCRERPGICVAHVLYFDQRSHRERTTHWSALINSQHVHDEIRPSA